MRAEIPEGRLSRLFWGVLDRVAYLLTDTRSRLFELIYSPKPATPADEKREADRKGLDAPP
jgi:hypothetical protein